ncbi:MAG TPA: helix-turn-helix transcriptional regulator [Stellaceae bacterium]
MTERNTKAAAIDRHVGIRLRTLRIMAGLTQREVAHMLGCTDRQIDGYEHGAKRLSAGRLLEVARILGVTIEDLFQGIDAELQSPALHPCPVELPAMLPVSSDAPASAPVPMPHLHTLHTLTRALDTTH